MSAVLATFVDARPVKTRSVLQLVLEVPIEEADAAMKALGGFPLPSESRWVGIALAPKDRPKDQPDETEKKRRQFDSLQPSAQAAILCNDPAFLEFLFGDAGITYTPAGAAQEVRKRCQVESRSEFNTDPRAANRWEVLKRQFKQFQTDARYAESRTH